MVSQPEHAKAAAGSGADGEAEVDLAPDLCAEIQTFADTLPEMSYYEVLGISMGAEPDEIRRAFFQRSKRYHPDRYFSKRLGAYAQLLHEIYKRVLAAHDVLRDPRLRAEYDKIAGPRLSVPLPTTPVAEEKSSSTPRRAASSLRSRKGLRPANAALDGLTRQLATSRERARRHFADAHKESTRGDWVRAASLVRLALAFDPREQSYHEALAEYLPRANAEQVQLLCRKGEAQLALKDRSSALECFEEAFWLSPTDAGLAHRIAELVLGIAKDHSLAAEFASRAVELDEKNASYYKTLARVHQAAGADGEARRALQRAWELDPLDREVKAALAGRVNRIQPSEI